MVVICIQLERQAETKIEWRRERNGQVATAGGLNTAAFASSQTALNQVSTAREDRHLKCFDEYNTVIDNFVVKRSVAVTIDNGKLCPVCLSLSGFK